MARLNSFYCPTDLWPDQIGKTLLFKGSEARHMLTVLRTETDQVVRLFDGAGQDGLFKVREKSHKQALLEALSLTTHQREENGLTLAIGWGKSQRRNFLFEKAVELHANSLIFWNAHRSQGRIPKEPKESWKDKCLQAAKQCGNPFIPQTILVDNVTQLVALKPHYDTCFFAWEAQELTSLLNIADLKKKNTLVVIGPEGGFEESEAHILKEHDFFPVSLGNSILRWETAALYCLSLGWFAQQEL